MLVARPPPPGGRPVLTRRALAGGRYSWSSSGTLGMCPEPAARVEVRGDARQQQGHAKADRTGCPGQRDAPVLEEEVEDADSLDAQHQHRPVCKERRAAARQNGDQLRRGGRRAALPTGRNQPEPFPAGNGRTR